MDLRSTEYFNLTGNAFEIIFDFFNPEDRAGCLDHF